MSKSQRAIRPDAQAFDEVTIRTVPRFKTSGLSGDEWRISAVVEFKHKGKVLHTQSWRDVECALRFADHAATAAMEDGKCFFAGQGDLCDQEGCAEKWTVVYKRKMSYCGSPNNNKVDQENPNDYRCFCARHSTRGDSSFDDSDSNYELVDGATMRPAAGDLSPASFGGVVDLP